MGGRDVSARPAPGLGTAAPPGPPDVLIQLMGESAREDPYPIYSWLREKAPVYPSMFGATLISRFDDCLFVMKDAELFPGANEDELARSFPQAIEHPAFEVLVTALVGCNPPKHTRLRHLVGREFTARRVAGLKADIEQITDGLLDRVEQQLADGGTVDLHRMVSVPVPLHVIAELVGVPEADRAELAVEVPQMMNVVDPTASPAAVQAADDAFANLGRYFDHLIAERRAKPREDLVSALVSEHDVDADRLSDAELRNLLFTLWAAGFETTATAIDNAVLTLMRYPDSGSWLESADGADAFIEEVLRFDPPVQVAPGIRFAARDCEVGGHAITAGTQVRLMLGAALRDPLAYDDPDRFDPARKGPQPFSFGAGIHYCLGAGLSKLEMAVLLPKLRARLPGLRLAAPPQRRRSIPLRDFESLVVRN